MIPRSVGLLAAVGCTSALNLVPRQEAPPAFNWTTVIPSSDLKTLVPCFGTFQCGRLNVPLDYSRTDGPNAIIPVAVLPATDKANYKGSILINPGGPGGPGAQAVLGLGPLLASIVGPTYDIVGFDPRGTGDSVPIAKCFDKASYATFAQSERFTIESKEDLAYVLARETIISDKCAEVLGGSGQQEAGGTIEEWGGGHFMNTAVAAEDMLSIVQALGQEKLNLIALSYGSTLGATFASMHPDKVGLMHIDGVVDASLWHAGDVVGDMRDSDKVVGAFFDLCTKAGKTVCPIAESSSKKTEQRVNTILASLRARPIPVFPHANGFSVVTFDMVHAFFRTRLYVPGATFPDLAAVLAAVEARNVTALYGFGANDPTTGLAPWFPPDQTLQAIACSDWPDFSKTSFDEAWGWVQNATRTSKYVGNVMARVQVQCIPWKVRAAKRFEGSIGAKQLSGKLLITNNVLDPVTPLADARSIHQRFPGSSLLIQNTVGHCTILNLGSCTAQAIGAFFQTGVLPKDGTVCEPDQLPFVGAVTKGISSGI